MLSTQNSVTSSKRSMATQQIKKTDRYTNHINSTVTVSNFGAGILRYYKSTGTEKICGVELTEPNGDCDGEDLDGNKNFSCEPNHGVYVTMKEVTLVDDTGKPTAKKATSTKPKKKFEDPPSLRKKIIRKEAPSRKGEPKIQKTKLHDNIRKTGQKSTKVDHLAKKKTGVAESVKSFAEPKMIKRAQAAAPVVAPSTDATSLDEELPELDDDDDMAAAKKLVDVPEDWVAAAKREQKEKEDAIAREKELADIKAQEIRLAEAEKKRVLQEEEFNKKAEEEARKRDLAREERKLLQEQKAAERAAKRVEQEAAALAMVDEYAKVQEEEHKEREAKARALNDSRMAQKARIAAMMNRVKTNTSSRNSSGGSSGTSSPSVESSAPEEL
eukprot:m.62524 g.62524  ORF g.62524 m.62524 type:complete len:385 (+) comp23168_c0_seq2:395-1549(+)